MVAQQGIFIQLYFMHQEDPVRAFLQVLSELGGSPTVSQQQFIVYFDSISHATMIPMI